MGTCKVVLNVDRKKKKRGISEQQVLNSTIPLIQIH